MNPVLREVASRKGVASDTGAGDVGGFLEDRRVALARAGHRGCVRRDGAFNKTSHEMISIV